MSGHFLPERVEELIAGYVLGNLNSEEAEELRRLIAENPELGTEVNRLQEVLELMPYALPEVAPPPHLRSAILEASEAEIKRSQTAAPASYVLPTRFANAGTLRHLPWRNIAGSIAALLVVAFGVDNYLLRQQLGTMQAQADKQKDVIAMLQNPNTHLVSLKGMDMASAAAGSIVITPGEPKAVLILQNLPVLPKGQFYQLWSVVNGEKIPSGQFNPSSRGSVLVKLPTPPTSDVAALIVTVEVSATPTSPSGPMVMTTTI